MRPLEWYKSLYRIIDNGDAIEHVYTFKDKINAIHFAPEGLFVATDISHWDSKTPCVIYRSRDQGKSFRTVWTLEQSSAMWWSIASSKAGDLYIGEYGPRDRGLSKRVHRSQDGGDTWQTVFEAADNDKTHIHRVAVDPYDGAVWVTIGDGRRNRGAFVSHDRGRTWQRVLDSQATGIAFTPSAVYFGEDHKKKGRVSRYDKRSKTYREVFRASSFGNYGGSIYDLAMGADGSVYVPTMKYENQDHIISLWHGSADHWSLLLRLESKPGVAGGLGTIAGPDRDGWVYVTGFKIRDH